MRYVTSVERIGIKKGLQQGLQQGELRVLRRQLTRRFGELPAWAETRLQKAPPERLERAPVGVQPTGRSLRARH